MPTISIWGRLGTRAPERIDGASNVKEANYLVGEYRLAFGQGWKIWSGPKINEPGVGTSLEEMRVIKNRYRQH